MIVIRPVLPILHPLLFGVYSVLRICADPTDPSPPSQAVRPLLVVLAGVLLLLVAAKPLLPRIAPRALLVSFLILGFSDYLFALLAGSSIPGVGAFFLALLRHPAMGGLFFLALLVLVWFLLRRTRRDLSTLTVGATILGAGLAIGATVNGISPWLRFDHAPWMPAVQTILSDEAERELHPRTPLPDIYYVVVDGYARQDVLQDLYSLDNDSFLQSLRERGFFIPSRSCSNYMQTYLSLASTLNLSYLDALAGAPGFSPKTRLPLYYLIQKSRAVRTLKRAGYRFVLVPSVYAATDHHGMADVRAANTLLLNGVENKILSISPLTAWKRMRRLQYEAYRRHLGDNLDALGAAVRLPGPKLVLAHLVLPHPPFVFGQSGEPVLPDHPLCLNDGSFYMGSREEYVRGYTDQLAYTNMRILALVDSLQLGASEPPVIILQADHGPGSMLDWKSVPGSNTTERVGIFAAYCVPDELRSQLYDTMTPVNAIRFLLNHVAGTEFERLEDKSYFSTRGEPYDFHLVPPVETR